MSPDPAALLAFVDELRRAGYNIGSEQYIAAQDLILALAARSESLDRSGRLRGLLGPVLCSKPREQDEFGDRFDDWAERLALSAGRPIDAGSATRPKGSGASKGELTVPAQRSRRWRWGLAALCVLAIWVLVAKSDLPDWVSQSLPRNPGSVEVPPVDAEDPTAEPRQPAAALSKRPSWPSLLALVLVVALFGLAWRYRAHLFISRWAVPWKPRVFPLEVEGLKGELFHGLSLARTARDLRRRRKITSNELDIAATIEQTAGRAGWLYPVYATRPIIPEYLLLVDRASYRDHQARLMDELVERLEENGVLITRYYFDADPRICFSFSEDGSPLNLGELAAKHPDHHLLILSDAGRFFNSRTGELEPWIEQFVRWQDRAIVTPELAAHWGFREWVLFRNFAVLPATPPEGLASLIGRAGRSEPPTEPGGDALGPIPMTLREQPLRWLDRHSPEASVVEETLKAVELFLGEEGVYWLRASAVYPELDWNLLVYLGHVLKTTEGHQLLEEGRLTSLVRLPWFRHGLMPDWLRLRLVQELSPKQEDNVRTALERLLRSAQGAREGFPLQIAHAKSLLRLLLGKAHEDSQLRDHVFVTFMAGQSLKPQTWRQLVIRLPRELYRRFKKRATPWMPRALATLSIVMVSVLLWERPWQLPPQEPPSSDSPGAEVVDRGEDPERGNLGGGGTEEEGVEVVDPEGRSPETVETETVETETVETEAETVVPEDPGDGGAEGGDSEVGSPGGEGTGGGGIGGGGTGGEESHSGSTTPAPFPSGSPPSVPPPPGPPNSDPSPSGPPTATEVINMLSEGALREAERAFKRGIRANDLGNWEVTAQQMLEAQRAPATGKRLFIYASRIELYLPYFYRGVALYRLGRCDEAVAEWDKSERAGAIKEERARDEREQLEELRAQCESDP